MDFLAVLGRQPEISLAELEALFSDVKQVSKNLAIFSAPENFNFSRLGGSLKIAVKLPKTPLDFLKTVENRKIVFGLSDYSPSVSTKSITLEALKLKKILVRFGHSVRVVENKTPVLSTATSLHNGLSGKNLHKFEFIKYRESWFKVVHIQDIDAYANRDQARPARDARVGMLPPKLAQILINLCGPLKENSLILDPFCGTGVVPQEALLMGYSAYGTDINERMVEYSRRNLEFLQSEKFRSATAREETCEQRDPRMEKFQVSPGDATNYKWNKEINAVACESYLGKPFSNIPTEIELKEQKQECSSIILGFLKNLSSQIKTGTPVVVAIPAWLREDNYSRLDILDLIAEMGYNVNNKSREGLLYHREGQIVARDIIILRKN
ncbi:hypothetical protein IJJ49_00200 [Candidatus Saccharibacteria bacterium]|nr:hypothetical protein [Candidatus Saccharibacteria bacterium]